MNMTLNTVLLTLAIGAPTAWAADSDNSSRICPMPWLAVDSVANDCSLVEYTFHRSRGEFEDEWEVKAEIRSGYFPENEYVPFRGNIIFYQGLADSMVNHQPLFAMLANAGYRVIAFDYMGQGGSGGTMNDTRIQQIGELGDQIWATHARDLKHFPKKFVIGWSTGGLAAYTQARKADDERTIVLIAPALAPRKLVGEQKPLEFKFNQITLPTLTTHTYTDDAYNPHVDPIRPLSSLDTPRFFLDLLWTAYKTKSLPMGKGVNGFVLLSGVDDSYVDAEATLAIIKAQADHFQIKDYPNTLHEIDNEAEPNGSTSRRDILDFIERSDEEG